MKRSLSIIAVLMICVVVSSCSQKNLFTRKRVHNYECFCQTNHHFKDTSYFKEYHEEKNPYVYKSTRDYTTIAKSITKNCKTDYEKVCAIYKWICDNISYDTSYEIYDADRCYRYKKGICSAYCNLFYYIAKAADVRTKIVKGFTKDYLGNIDDRGHVWIFAYIDKDYGILLDPTWGAGSVGLCGGDFIKREDCWEWFNVDPKWMIFSHFPDDKSYQFLEDTLTLDEFRALPKAYFEWLKYVTPSYIYERASNNELSMPSFHSSSHTLLEIVSIPMVENLNVGETYTFSIRPKAGLDWAIDVNGKWYDDWEKSDDGTYTMTITISSNGMLSIRVKLKEGEIYRRVVNYDLVYL